MSRYEFRIAISNGGSETADIKIFVHGDMNPTHEMRLVPNGFAQYLLADQSSSRAWHAAESRGLVVFSTVPQILIEHQLQLCAGHPICPSTSSAIAKPHWAGLATRFRLPGFPMQGTSHGLGWYGVLKPGRARACARACTVVAGS